MTLRPEAIERMKAGFRAVQLSEARPRRNVREWEQDAWEAALSALESLLAERGCRVVGPNVTEEMVTAALDRHQGPNGSLYGTIFTAMLARSVSPLSAEDPAHG